MTHLAISPWPPGAAPQASLTRWQAWFTRYINAMGAHQRRQQVRRAWAGFGRRDLADIGVTQAQRFVAVHIPFEEH